jgi:hypothetical protein
MERLPLGATEGVGPESRPGCTLRCGQFTPKPLTTVKELSRECHFAIRRDFGSNSVESAAEAATNPENSTSWKHSDAALTVCL